MAKKGKPAEPPAKTPSEALSERVLLEMRRLAENGIKEFTSTMLRDKLALDRESGRGVIRNVMKKLADAGKIQIAVKEGGRKQFVYRLKD